MSKISGYNLFENQSNMVHKQIDVDELFDDSLKSKKSKSTPGFADGQSAIYEPSKPKQASATYEKPVSISKKNPVAATNTVELSEKAQALLEELKEKYGDTDFVIANYSSDEEAQALMAGGTKDYSVLIDPETLEKMAADDEVKDQYISQIDSAKDQMTSMMEELKESGEDVESVGVTIKADGTISYFAKLREESEARSEKIQEGIKEAREEKKIKEKAMEEKKAQEKQLEKAEGSTIFTADSIEELIEKIKASKAPVVEE